MSHELICTWLGLPATCWPPDHYTLLGLERGEANPDRIEQQVHEHLERVRRYQLAHPEQVTEAMNRLAQAFVCLTDPEAKRAYDATLGLTPALRAAGTASPESQAKPAAGSLLFPSGAGTVETVDPLAWLFGPWNPAAAQPAAPGGPRLVDWASTPPPPRLEPEPGTSSDPVSAADGTATVGKSSAETAVEHTLLPAELSPLPQETPPLGARRGLGTKRVLYYRVSRTRQLLWAWEQAGRYLNHPSRLLTRPTEATELIRLLQSVRRLLRTFPPLLGEAGQPGDLVLALARQQLVVPTFQTLLPSQREALARDWQAGRTLLVSHREFLRQELRGLRGRGRLGRAFRSLRLTLRDHPGIWLFLLGLLAFNLAYPPLRICWPQQVIIMVATVAYYFRRWWDSHRPTKPVRTTSAPPRRPARSRPKTQRQTP
jgi:hypothetical protein